jgi:hypothetical protein
MRALPLYLTAISLVAQVPGQNATLPAVLKTLQVGGDGGWDYVAVDAEAGRIYLPRGTRVMVLDLDGKSIGEIPDTAGVHGVAIARDLDRGFTSNGRADTVTVFKLSTLEVVKVVKVTGANPDAILYDPATKKVFTFNGRGQNATVLDASSLEVLATIPVGGKPEFPAADGKGKVFVNVEDTAEILLIDAKSCKVESRWSLAPLQDPTGLALDRAGGRLFTVGRNKLAAVVDATTGKVLQTLPIGSGTDGIVYDPGLGCAYASNGEGSVTVLRKQPGGSYAVAGTVPTKTGARTLGLDEKNHRLYLPTAEFEPAPPAKEGEQRPRPKMVQGSFQLVVVGTQERPAALKKN